MAEYFLCRINGRPKGKGRPRFNKSGRAYTPKATREYEKAVREAAMKAAAALQWLKPDKEVPLEVSVTAYFPVPKSWRKADREAAYAGDLYPVSKPDIDNVEKLVLDALNGIAYHDDCRIVSVSGRKRYAGEDEEPHVLVYVARQKTFSEMKAEALARGKREW